MVVSRNWVVRGVACVLGLALVAVSPVTRAADAPPDPSSPKGVAYAFGQAIEKRDKDAAKALTTGTEEDLKLIDSLAALSESKNKLHEAAEKKFGKDEVTTGAPQQGPGANAGAERFKGAANWEEKIDGDTATLTPKGSDDAGAGGPPGRRGAAMGAASKPMQFKKIDGKWKFEASSMVTPERRQLFFTYAEAAAKVNAEVADGITGGTYASNEAAKAALREKMATAMRGAFGGGIPGGRPGRPGTGN